MGKNSEPWQVEFYCDHRNRCPVQEFLDGLPEKESAKASHQIDLLELLGIYIGREIARPLSGHNPLWELRPFPNRIIYFLYTGRRFVLLHGFKKAKKKKTQEHIKTAEKRMNVFLEEENE